MRETSRHIPETVRASIARELSRFYAELSGNEPREAPRFSVARMLMQMSTEGGLRTGFEKQICAAAATIAGQHFDQHRVIVPFRRLRHAT